MKVSHTCLLVGDLERALEFYAWLGFEERMRLGEGENLSVFCGLPGDEDRLQLKLAPPSQVSAPRLGHLAIDVDDLDRLLQSLTGHGVVPEQPPPPRTGTLRLCFIHDPDGYAIELIERNERSGAL